jgi:hypothetical protein
VTEFALPVVKNNKPEFHQRIWSAAVESAAVWDAMEDGHTLLGLISRTVEFQLDGFTIQQAGANHTAWLHAIIIPLENTNHAVLSSQLQNVKSNVFPDIQPTTKKISISPKKFLLFQRMLLKFKPKL